MIKKPSVFHLREINISCREGFNKFSIELQVREIMKIYRILKKRNENKITDKIRRFLNSFAECCGYKNFNIDDEISVKKINDLDNGDE